MCVVAVVELASGVETFRGVLPPGHTPVPPLTRMPITPGEPAAHVSSAAGAHTPMDVSRQSPQGQCGSDTSTFVQYYIKVTVMHMYFLLVVI